MVKFTFQQGFEKSYKDDGYCVTPQQIFVGLQDVFKRCLEDLLKTSWRQEKSLLGISASNKFKFVSNKSITQKSISDESKANPKCII